MSMRATARVCVAVGLVGTVASVCGGADFAVLSDQSHWRYHAAWQTPATVDGGNYDLGGGHPIPNPGTRWIKDTFTEPTPGAEDGWTAPDYDDANWRRSTAPPMGGYGYGNAASIYLVCARTRFGLSDPGRVGPMKLKLTYRGGVVVFLNGREIARGDMPAGKVGPMTLARDYSNADVLGPDGRLLRPTSRGKLPRGAKVSDYAKRFRTLAVTLPAAALRKGTNVLAVEVHRAALPARIGPVVTVGWNPQSSKDIWGTCGLVSVSLLAPPGRGLTPNPAPLPKVQVWNCDTLERPGRDVLHGNPLEPLQPIRMATPRNGVSSGQVVVSSEAELPKISAKLSDLKNAAGARLAARHIEIRYATAGDSVPQLLARPTAGATTVPIWMTARVPTGTPAGVFRGTLTIGGIRPAKAVPVELTVYPWTLPDLKDYGTSVSFLHCPESSSRLYKAPLWSAKHFALVENSMKLMGYAGNTLLSVPLIAEDVFGDQALIVFRKEGGKAAPDFRFAKRYLALYDKCAAPPRHLSVQIWNYHVSARGRGRDGGKRKWIADTIKVRFLEGDKLVPGTLPTYSKPGTEETWKAVADGMRQIVKDLGWTKTKLLWGTGGDNLPNEEIAAFFNKISPDFQWRVVTHGGSIGNWGTTRRQSCGVVVGYANLVRRNHNRRPLSPESPLDSLKRDGVGSYPMDYLTLPPLGRIAANYSGTGFLSFDGWSWEDGNGPRQGPVRHYVPFGNILTSGSPFVAPGVAGAEPSPQLESFRDGLQITEACLHLRQAARDGKLPPALAAEATATIQVLMDQLESNRKIRPAGTADIWPTVRKVYELVSWIAP